MMKETDEKLLQMEKPKRPNSASRGGGDPLAKSLKNSTTSIEVINLLLIYYQS